MFIAAPKNMAKVEKLMKSWPKRADAVLGYVAYLAADAALDQVKRKIPNSAEWKKYRNSLTLARVSGLPAYCVYAAVKSGKGKKVDPKEEILFIKPTRRSKRIPKRVKILQEFSPWTWETLPFMPSKRNAVIVTRRVRKKESDKIGEDRNADERSWRGKLLKAGIRATKADRKKIKIPRKAKVITDVAFEALRLEFGLGGMKPKAHWRPAIMRLKSLMLKRIMSNKKVKAAMMDPSFTGWKGWPPRVKGTISASRAKSFVAFQKKVGG